MLHSFHFTKTTYTQFHFSMQNCKSLIFHSTRNGPRTLEFSTYEEKQHYAVLSQLSKINLFTRKSQLAKWRKIWISFYRGDVTRNRRNSNIAINSDLYEGKKGVFRKKKKKESRQLEAKRLKLPQHTKSSILTLSICPLLEPLLN